MKKVKLIGLLVVIFFLGISNAKAQGKSTVLIKVVIVREASASIVTVKPDNTKYELNTKDEDPYVILKKELDKWILEGYSIMDSNVSGLVNTSTTMVYYLKKD